MLGPPFCGPQHRAPTCREGVVGSCESGKTAGVDDAADFRPVQVTRGSGSPPATAGPDSALDLDAHLDNADRLLLEAGSLTAAREVFAAAARASLRAGDAHRLARAALGLGGLWVHEHRTAVEAARVTMWQERALAGLEPSSSLAVRLRTRLAAERDYRRGTTEEIVAALASARAADDPIVLAEALSLTHHCLLGPEHAHLRLELADELLRVASLTQRVVDEVLGLLWRTVDLLLAGDPHADRSVRELTDVTQRQGLGAVDFVLAAIRVMLLVRQGDLAGAEAAAQACYHRGEQVGDADALGWYVAQLFNVRWFQGRLPELLPTLRAVVDSPTLAGPNEALLTAAAVAQAQAGEVQGAAVSVRRIRADGLVTLPRSSTWLVTLAGMVEAAAALADESLAGEAAGLLQPYVGQPIMASLAVVCFGSAAYALGRAGMVTGDHATAERHLRAAVVANERLGHLPAAAAAEERLRELSRLRQDLLHPAVTAARTAAGWRICWGDHGATVPDSVGAHYLAVLIGRPGDAVSAWELVRGADQPLMSSGEC